MGLGIGMATGTRRQSKMTKKIAAFDFDGTIVRPREGRQFPKDRADWRWTRPSVPDRLRELAASGEWSLMIITDQTKGWKEDMIADVVAAIGVPIEVLVQRTVKKPDTSLITARGVTPAFYVGDAAGRVGDWSDCDRAFAAALGIPFHTPEEFFPAPPARERTVAAGPPREVVIMVGYPASGKSTIARDLVARGGYHHVNGDDFPTPAAMVRAAKKHPAEAIVFDSTGGTAARRATFIEWAKAESRPVRILWVTTDIDTAMDWNAARAAYRGGAVPAIAYYTFRKRFEPPTEAEGAPVTTVD
jgi:bifunctional polynucleotide phosphatase/kinase